MLELPTEQEILSAFEVEMECAQVTLAPLAQRLDLAPLQSARLAACFGGGMGCGGPCGAVSAALMALGLSQGHDGPHQEARKFALLSERDALLAAVRDTFGGVTCPEILALHPWNELEYNPICAKVIRFVLRYLDARV